jgi:hypothetical protein
MTNLQDQMTSGEAELMWNEFCYHNTLCDSVSFMLKYGRDKVINDIVDMYESAEAIND